MLVVQFVIILLIFHVSLASDSIYSINNNFKDENNDRSACDIKLTAVLKNEILKLNDVNKKVLDSLEALNRKLDASEKNMNDKFDDLENKFNVWQKKNYRPFEEKREQNILDMFREEERRIVDKIEEYTNEKLDSIEEHIYRKIDALEKIVADNMNHNLDVIDKNVQNISFKLSILNNVATLNKLSVDEVSLKKKNKSAFWDCKERAVGRYKFDPIGMDSKTFNNVVYENIAGATHFETYFAVKSLYNVDILLSSMLHPGKYDEYFAIVIGDLANTKTVLRIDRLSNFGVKELHRVHTPGVLSSIRFTAFYMKIKNGTLELGDKKSGLPILTYTDEGLKSVKYIGFTGPSYSDKVIYLYDCPSNLEETLHLYDRC